MIKSGLSGYQGKKVLMLQGPVGPFFRRLSIDLKNAGAEVFKVNFNGGDSFFYPTDYIPFKDGIEEWPEFFESLLVEKKIEIVLLFGDCRRMHQIAGRIASKRGVDVGVFEEGYVRPDYITLEYAGVNGNSFIPKDPTFYYQTPVLTTEKPLPVGQTLWHATVSCILYYTAAICFDRFYPNYKHHRPLSFRESLPFFSSYFWRKFKYRFSERGVQEELVNKFSGKYFLLPLQVHNDSQIVVHSKYSSNEQFMEEVFASFAQNAPADTLLVIKHHPMDRGYNDYSSLIKELAQKNNLPTERWRYIHDQHLPTLLAHAQGVVLVNSTVGLQAVHHKCPTIACGKAIYDIAGLTFRGSLTQFWKEASGFSVDQELYERFRNYLITRTQLNGNIYKRLNVNHSSAGLIWPDYKQEEAFSTIMGHIRGTTILEIEEEAG